MWKSHVFVRISPSPSPTVSQGWLGKHPNFSYLRPFLYPLQLLPTQDTQKKLRKHTSGKEMSVCFTSKSVQQKQNAGQLKEKHNIFGPATYVFLYQKNIFPKYYEASKILSGGNETLTSRRFPTVGIVQIIRQTTTQLHPQTSSPWCSVCPPLRRRFNESPQSYEWVAI